MDRPELSLKTEKLREVFERRFPGFENAGVRSGFGFPSGVLFDIFVSKFVRFSVCDDGWVDEWISIRRNDTKLKHELAPLAEIKKWKIDESSGDISHESGRFFSIIGLKVRHRHKFEEIIWDQPIIDQPEVGILGILLKKINGVLHFLLQAKEEPGNIGLVQLSPTVQATYSNYTMAHGGTIPAFIEYFLAPQEGSVVFSKLQAEDGGRFLFKSNKNMLVMLDEGEVPEPPSDFIWLTLRQISMLLERDNLVNSCARSVLSCML